MTDDRPITDEEIGAFVDREATGAQRATLAERLLADPRARARHDVDTRLKHLLREELAAFDPDPTAYVLEASALAAARARPERSISWRTACSAIALIGLGWGGHMGVQAWSESLVPALVEDAAQAHQVFAHDSLRPVESHNATTLTTWFTGHLGEPVTIPDLRPAGLRFIGGRLLSSDNGALAQIIYEDAHGQRLSLYIAENHESGEDGEGIGDEMEIIRLDEVDAGYWRDGGVAYAVVAESSVEQVILVASVIGVTPEGFRAD